MRRLGKSGKENWRDLCVFPVKLAELFNFIQGRKGKKSSTLPAEIKKEKTKVKEEMTGDCRPT